MFPEKSDIDHFVHGSTYVSIEDAIHMQLHLGKEQQLKMTFDMRTKDSLPEVSIQARRNWPPFIYPCQKFNKTAHGNYVCTIPKFNNRNVDSKSTWIVFALITRIKELWFLTDQCSLYESKWHDWVLAYAAKYCFNHKGSGDKRNPFKLNYVSFIKKIVELTCVKDRLAQNEEEDENNEEKGDKFQLTYLSEMFIEHESV